MYMKMSVTCSCGGTGPGSMLFDDVYSLGICASRLQREHSVLRAAMVRLRKSSKHEVQVRNSKVANLGVEIYQFGVNGSLFKQWKIRIDS